MLLCLLMLWETDSFCESCSLRQIKDLRRWRCWTVSLLQADYSFTGDSTQGSCRAGLLAAWWRLLKGHHSISQSKAYPEKWQRLIFPFCRIKAGWKVCTDPPRLLACFWLAMTHRTERHFSLLRWESPVMLAQEDDKFFPLRTVQPTKLF